MAGVVAPCRKPLEIGRWQALELSQSVDQLRHKKYLPIPEWSWQAKAEKQSVERESKTPSWRRCRLWAWECGHSGPRHCARELIDGSRLARQTRAGCVGGFFRLRRAACHGGLQNSRGHNTAYYAGLLFG